MDDTDLNRLRELKRDYLCSNLDPNLFEEFAEFAESHAEQTGTDVDSWSLQKIQDVTLPSRSSSPSSNNPMPSRSLTKLQSAHSPCIRQAQEKD